MTMSSDFPVAPKSTGFHRWRDYALLSGLFVLVLAGLASLAAATGWDFPS